MLDYDNRIEVPEGLTPSVEVPNHPVIGGTSGEWPPLLGYNRVVAKPDSTVVAQVRGDPLLVVGSVSAGRAVAFTSDLAPHWAPPEFLSWPHYRQLWASIITWTGKRL